MMRTIEILIVIIIITGAFISVSFFAVLPWPRQVSPMNLRRLAFTTLEMLDSDYELSRAAFETGNSTIWGGLQVALAASLPPNVIYNLTIYEVTGETTQLYSYIASMSNAENLGATSDASSYMVASSNVTFNVVPEKIGAHGGGGTLYILNCSDAPGWWVTGYTSQGLAQDLYSLLSPYFSETVMVQSTTELETILNGNPLHGESLQNAVVINTCGEAVPIPSSYASYSGSSYAEYFYELGKRVYQYNWTWTSIVGWPFYYVSNTGLWGYSNDNGWGIYGMRQTGDPGLNAFLQGLNNQSSYAYGHSQTSDRGIVTLSSQALDSSNYYGIYPSPYQTSTRALPDSISGTYNLDVTTYVFNPDGSWIPAAVYRHRGTNGGYQGGFYAIGLTRTPDIRLTALGLLADYHPRLYRSEYTANGTSRIVVLQLGLVGGV
jgi:hypothetical protein